MSLPTQPGAGRRLGQARRFGRNRARCVVAALALCVGWGVGGVRPAHAQAGKDEIQIAIGPVFAGAPSFASPVRGPGVQASAFWGLTSSWSVGGVANWTALSGTSESGTEIAGSRVGLFAGPAYNIDVITFVPYVSITPGVQYGPPEDGEPAWHAVVRGAVGVDYRRWRHWAVGAQVEWHAALPQVLDYPSESVVWLRLVYVFERNAL
jgi:hypothetical protein